MKTSARRKARRLALQAIYQWQFEVASIEDIEQRFLARCNPKKVDLEYFSKLVLGAVNNVSAIDELIVEAADRAIVEVHPIELAILRVSTFELLYCLDVPYKVVINEALESTKTFGAAQGVGFVNGVLDKIARQLRKVSYEKNK